MGEGGQKVKRKQKEKRKEHRFENYDPTCRRAWLKKKKVKKIKKSSKNKSHQYFT